MKIIDIERAAKLNRQDKYDLRVLLRLYWSGRGCGSYTEAEKRAESKVLRFIRVGILDSTG